MRGRQEAGSRSSLSLSLSHSISSAASSWPLLLTLVFLWPLTFAPDSASAAQPPSQVLCVDPSCLGVISTATTTSKYIKQDNFLLSFNSNTKLRVIAKPLDDKEEYWAVEMNGAFGFVPKMFLRESGVLSRAKHLVNIDDFFKILSKNSYDSQRQSKRNLEEIENRDVDNEDEDTEDEDDEDAYMEDDHVVDPTKPPSKKHKRRDQPYKDVKDADNLYAEDDFVDNSTKPSTRKRKRTDPSYIDTDDVHAEGKIEDDPTKPPHKRHRRTDPPNKDEKEAVDGDDFKRRSHKKRERTDPPNYDENNAADGDDFKRPSHKKREKTDPPNYGEKDAVDGEKFEKTDPSYYDEKYQDSKMPREKKQYTEELQLSTTTVEPIISSALPESDPNSENISATQSVTVIDGTTIYDSMKSEEQIYKKAPYNQDNKNSKISQYDNTVNDSSKDVNNSITNKPESVEEKATAIESNITEDKKSLDVDEKQQNTLSSNLTPTPYMVQENSNVDNTSNNNLEPKEVTSQESDDDDDDEDDIDEEDENDEETVDSDYVFADQENTDIANMSTVSNKVKAAVDSNQENASSIVINKDIPEESPVSSTGVENTPEQLDKPSDITFSNKDTNIEQTTESGNNNSESIELTSTVAPSVESVNDEVQSNILPTENNVLNSDQDGNDTNTTITDANEFPSQDVIITKYEPIEVAQTEESKYYNENEKTDSLNSNETDVPEITPPSKEVGNDAPFYKIPLIHTIMSSPPPINTNVNPEIESTSQGYVSGVESPETTLTNDPAYESQFMFEPAPTTVATDTSDSTSDMDASLPVSTTEMNMFDYAENLSDDYQPSNLLDSDIANEKSFFSSPLILLNSMYESISNIFKSDGISNTVEKANTNIFNTEEINSNEYQQQYENAHHSNKYIPVLTETSHCSAEEKTLPSLSDVSTDFIFWLIISAISVLMFTLGYYYLENRKQDGKLLAMVNSLQKELLCSSKECIILKEELTTTKEKLIGIEDSSFGADEMVACLKKELVDSQQVISDLQEKIVSAEDELANSTEAALELQSILDEQLSVKDTSSSSLAFTITNLQSQLDDQQTTMNLTKAQLAAKMEENELLLLKIMDANNRSSSIEKQLINTQESLKQAVQENENKSQQLLELASNLERSLLQAEIQKNAEVKELQLLIKDLKDDLNTTKALLKASSHEVLSLQDSIKMLNMDEKNISAILDVSHIKAELVKVSSEKSSLIEKFEAENALVADLNTKIDSQNLKISEIREQLHEADQKTLQSTTRLEVLTNYFNQKEADLLKELSTKESLWMSQQGEAMSTVEKIQSLQKEIQQHKETSESIRREVVEQEAAWRAKVAALEQRSHEHWLARRAAERSAEASAREAQTLRQRLAVPSPDKRVVSPLTTGESLPDAAFLPSLGALGGMLPPPPLGFLPPPLGGPMMLPPPLPPLPPHRPPPLGRLSSPPPLQSMRQDRYSPDSRYSPDRGYSPQQRGRSPFSNSESRRRAYNNRRYDDRYYDSEEDRRSRRYETETDFSPVNTLPPSPIPNSRNHKDLS
ncbi:uncharacterized protein LOC143909574 isoform X2 [Arctopsyche grandis]|uniref:uncharacterized protein LOC143909574 isoform X2 n=1 Tax=Arctopsyche grandis TaxID=121162 RepID=UPI00406D890E